MTPLSIAMDIAGYLHDWIIDVDDPDSFNVAVAYDQVELTVDGHTFLITVEEVPA